MLDQALIAIGAVTALAIVGVAVWLFIVAPVVALVTSDNRHNMGQPLKRTKIMGGIVIPVWKFAILMTVLVVSAVSLARFLIWVG